MARPHRPLTPRPLRPGSRARAPPPGSLPRNEAAQETVVRGQVAKRLSNSSCSSPSSTSNCCVILSQPITFPARVLCPCYPWVVIALSSDSHREGQTRPWHVSKTQGLVPSTHHTSGPAGGADVVGASAGTQAGPALAFSNITHCLRRLHLWALWGARGGEDDVCFTSRPRAPCLGDT